MDDLINEMVEAGLVEVIYDNPAIKWTNGQLIYALTKPFVLEAEALMELKWFNDKTLEYNPSRFVRWMFNGVKVSNDNGGLN